MALELRRRDFVYVLPPKEYGIPVCHKCGGEVVWSSYVGRVWCNHCAEDILPENGGLFDGPIGVELCEMMGIVFHAIDLRCMALVKFNQPSWPYHPSFVPQGHTNHHSHAQTLSQVW